MNDDLLDQDGKSRPIKGGMDRRKGDKEYNSNLEGIKTCLSKIHARLEGIETKYENIHEWIGETKKALLCLEKETKVILLEQERQKDYCPYKKEITELINRDNIHTGGVKTWMYLPVIISVIITTGTFVILLLKK